MFLVNTASCERGDFLDFVMAVRSYYVRFRTFWMDVLMDVRTSVRPARGPRVEVLDGVQLDESTQLKHKSTLKISQDTQLQMFLGMPMCMGISRGVWGRAS